MSQYNVPDKNIGDPFLAVEHNLLKNAHNDTDNKTAANTTALSELGTASRLDVPSTAGEEASASQVVRGDDPRLQRTQDNELLVYRHDIDASGVWQPEENPLNQNADSEDPSVESKYSILEQLEDYRRPDGEFRLRVVYPNLGDGEFIEFEQTNNFVQDSTDGTGQNVVTGFVIRDSSSPEVRGAAGPVPFAGFNNSSVVQADIEGNTDGNSWFYPIGQTVIFNGGIPAFNNNGTSTITNVIEIYVVATQNTLGTAAGLDVPSTAGEEATTNQVVRGDDPRLQPTTELPATCFQITPADPALTSPNVFDWNTSSVNDIRATAFYITQDTSDSTPLTELNIPLGETETFYIVGPLYTSDTQFSNIGGATIEATNTGGVLSFNLVEQRFTAVIASWPNTTYDDLNSTNSNVGEFRQASVDFLFTSVPVNLSQVADTVKRLASAEDAIEVILDGTTFTLPTAVEGDVHNFTVAALPLDIQSSEPSDIADLNGIEVQDQLVALPTSFDVPTFEVAAEQPNNAPDTVFWTISDNVVLGRSSDGHFYNQAAGQSNDQSGNVTGTLWRNDTFTTPQGMQDSYDGRIGSNITSPEYQNVFITDTVTGIEHGPFQFTNWQGGGNGGGYTVEEVTSITPTPGWTVQRVTSRIDSVTGSAVDNSDPRNPVIDSPESLNFLSGFNSQAAEVTEQLIGGVPTVCVADTGGTFASIQDSNGNFPTTDIQNPGRSVYLDFTFLRSGGNGADSSFELLGFTDEFARFTFNIQSLTTSSTSGTTGEDPILLLTDETGPWVRMIVEFPSWGGIPIGIQMFRFRPAGDADIDAVRTVCFRDFEISTVNPVTESKIIGVDNVTNWPGSAGETLTSNGDGTFTFT